MSFYLAYGSNLNHEHMAVCCPNARQIGTGELAGYRLVFRDYLTIEPQGESVVPFAVWRLNAESERNLDQYEGFPNLYRKELFTVKVSGTELTAMAYIMNENCAYRLPSPDYYAAVRKGYQDNSLQEQPLVDALVVTLRLISASNNQTHNTKSQLGLWYSAYNRRYKHV